MFAIINKNTKQFVYATDYRQRYKGNVAKQMTSFDRALTYSSKEDAENDLTFRYMSNNYEVVEVEIKIIYPP